MSWNKRARRWLIGLIIGLLALCSTGCGKAQRTVIKARVEPILPPRQWVEPIEHPRLSGPYNRDLAILLKRQKKILEKYEVRLNKIRSWREDYVK